MTSISSIVDAHGGLSRRVLDYSLTMKRIVDRAKQPGFTVDDWAPLAEFIAVDEFERVGNYMEVMRWPDYAAALTKWAVTAQWDTSFRRITEAGNVVFLELEERNEYGGQRNTINSVSVYEFNDAGKLRHLDIYLQMKPPEGNGDFG